LKILFQQTQFLLGAAQASQFPEDIGFEVAFAGRSNAGKSSAINVLTQQKSLARTSKTPGRTQQINFFVIDNDRRLVDLPGYGFAKVSKREQAHWGQLLEQYLQSRESLRGLVLLMDSRHPLKDTDRMLIDWCIASELPCHLLLTKSDKLNNQERSKALNTVKQAVQSNFVTLQFFSALKKTGLDALEQQLTDWLQ